MWVVPLPLASAEPPPPRWYCWILAHQIRLAGRRAAVEWVHEVGFRIGTFREPAAPGLCHDCRARPALEGAAACAVCAERRADRRIMPTTVGTRCARCADADVAAVANRRYRERNRDAVNRPARERAGRPALPRPRSPRALPTVRRTGAAPRRRQLSDVSGPRPRRVSEVARGEVTDPRATPAGFSLPVRRVTPAGSIGRGRRKHYRRTASRRSPTSRVRRTMTRAAADSWHSSTPNRSIVSIRDGAVRAATVPRSSAVRGEPPVAELDEPPGEPRRRRSPAARPRSWRPARSASGRPAATT